MPATKTITVEYDLPQPPAKVWRALTEPALLEKWLMPNDIAPVVGHRFTFKTQPMGGWDGTVRCEILTVEPLKRLAYSWVGGADDGKISALNTIVAWTLTQKRGGGTLLLLEHSGFRDEDEFAFTTMSGGWKSHGSVRLKAALDALS